MIEINVMIPKKSAACHPKTLNIIVLKDRWMEDQGIFLVLLRVIFKILNYLYALFVLLACDDPLVSWATFQMIAMGFFLLLEL